MRANCLSAHAECTPKVAAEACPPVAVGRRRVTRYTLSVSKGSDLFPDERARIEVSLLTSAAPRQERFMASLHLLMHTH